MVRNNGTQTLDVLASKVLEIPIPFSLERVLGFYGKIFWIEGNHSGLNDR